jgi:hypothetical protein
VLDEDPRGGFADGAAFRTSSSLDRIWGLVIWRTRVEGGLGKREHGRSHLGQPDRTARTVE